MAYNDGYRPDEYEENVRRVRRPAQNETPRQNGQNVQRRRVTYTDGTPANTQRRVRPESDAAAYGQQRRPAAQNGQRRPVSAEGQQHRPSAPVNGQQRRPAAANAQRSPYNGGRGGYTGNHGNGGNRGNGGYGGGNRGRGGYGGGNGGNGRFDGPDHRKRDGKPIGICKALAIEMFVMILAAAGFFVVMLMRSQMLNAKLTAVVIAVCAAIAAVVGFLGWVHAYKQNITKGKQRAAFIASIVVSVLFTVVFIIGGVYVMKTVSTIQNVGGVTHEVSNYHVYVLEDDPAEKIEDAADYTFGILETQDRENVGQIIEDIEEELGTTIHVEEYPGVTGLADALNSHEVGAMIMGETFLDMFAGFEGYETFADTVRSIWTGTIETEIESVSEELSNIVTIYISGSDTRNSTLPTRSLSDVNLILRMNLDTHQALIISTPRDYYVYTSVSGGMRDKLTHAGAYGVQCSMDTLSSLYETDIDYYVRLNFVGFVDIIDALGGIDV